MSDIGINLRIDAQTDGLDRASESFKNFREQVSSILGVTDPEKVDAFWDNYNSGLDEAIEYQNKLTLIAQRKKKLDNQEDQTDDQTDDPERKTTGGGYSAIARTQATLTGLVRGGSKDAFGTILGGAENILGSVSALPMISGAATAAIAAGMATLGAGIVGNELSKAYEAVGPALMEATAALRLFGETGKEQSAKFQILMNEMSASASEYGYTLEQSLSLVTQIARGGAKRGEEKGIADTVMAASRNIGLTSPASELTNIATLGSRFGQGDALGYAIGSANNVVGSPRLLEQASALATMFEDVLAQGIEGSFKELSGTQNWLFRVFGERAAGQGGASIYSGLSSAVRGSTSLSSETDILKYQAARNLTGGNQLTSLMELEKGFTQPLFEEYMKLISGSSEWDRVFLTSKAFGVNLSTAKTMTAYPDLATEAYNDSVIGGGGSMKDTTIVDLLGAQEKIATHIKDVGANAIEIKEAVLTEGTKIVDAIMGSAEKRNENIRYEANFGSLNRTATGETTFAGLMDLMSGVPSLESNWAKVDVLFAKNRAKLSQMPEPEVKKLLNIEQYDKATGWSDKELSAVIKLLEQVAKYTGDMSRLEITVTPDLFNQ